MRKEEKINNEIFDLEQHIALFRKNFFFQINQLSKIDKILNSIEYSRVINNLYNFFNRQVPNVNGRSALNYYINANI